MGQGRPESSDCSCLSPLAWSQREGAGLGTQLPLSQASFSAMFQQQGEALGRGHYHLGVLPHVPRSVPSRPLPLVLCPAPQRGHLLLAGTGAHPTPRAQVPLPVSPGASRCLCSCSTVPSRTLLPACLTTVSPRCGHLLLGGFPFFIRLDNAFF